MLAGLATFLKSSFKFTTSGGDYQAADISLSSTRNHIRHIVLMSRGIENSVAMNVSFKSSSTHLYSLSLRPLLLRSIHDKSQKPRLAIAILRFLFKSFDCTGIYFTHQIQNTSRKCGLSGINMTNKHNVHVFPRVTFLLFFLLLLDYFLPRLLRLDNSSALHLHFILFFDILIIIISHFNVSAVVSNIIVLTDLPVLRHIITSTPLTRFHESHNLGIRHEGIWVIKQLHCSLAVAIANLKSSNP
mmetsp:Transcript_11433/g.18630  ORF Transcript_11433/g.18630 Transcript_11433/m.18630 type:complete len:244 (+) Transcript_11433:1135-1866(+)